MRTTPVEFRADQAAPANRAARRAAAKGKDLPGAPGLLPHRRTTGRSSTKPAHARADFAARRSG
jgi:hypothetical protein